jgi:acyl-CoA reductase-like NAD-dependent aldehyde dehydrogenase
MLTFPFSHFLLSLAIVKALMCCKTRNALVVLPHPRASKATAEAIRICCEAGEQAGAPKGWAQCIENPTLEESHGIMKSEAVRSFVNQLVLTDFQFSFFR